MPHSGGRVGAGIYLASEHAKSAGYVGCAMLGGRLVGCMMLVEAALGKEFSIEVDDSSLTAAPKGFDSVVARGRQEPDPAYDIVWTPPSDKGAKPVKVAQAAAIPVPKHSKSYFTNSEYLLYQESQHRIRFLCTFEFAHRGHWH